MKRLCYVLKRLSYILSGVAIILSVTAIANSKESTIEPFISSIELSHGYYKDAFFPGDSYQSKKCTNTVNRYSIRLETEKLLPEKWRVGGEFGYSAHKGDELKEGDYHMGHDAGFKEWTGSIIVTRDVLGNLYLGVLAGIGLVHEYDNGMQDLGNSWLLGTWGGVVGYKHRFGTSQWGARGEVRATHTSDPFGPDYGKNYVGWNLSFIRYF